VRLNELHNKKGKSAKLTQALEDGSKNNAEIVTE
jgi:hypothetical protein